MIGAPDVPAGIVLFENLEMVLNAGTEVTGWTVWVKTITTVEDAAGAESAGETTPPADEAMRGKAGDCVETTPGEVSVAVTGQTVVYR